jgi:hypothetical protein
MKEILTKNEMLQSLCRPQYIQVMDVEVWYLVACLQNGKRWKPHSIPHECSTKRYKSEKNAKSFCLYWQTNSSDWNWSKFSFQSWRLKWCKPRLIPLIFFLSKPLQSMSCLYQWKARVQHCKRRRRRRNKKKMIRSDIYATRFTCPNSILTARNSEQMSNNLTITDPFIHFTTNATRLRVVMPIDNIK